jgi:hypothetical protein
LGGHEWAYSVPASIGIVECGLQLSRIVTSNCHATARPDGGVWTNQAATGSSTSEGARATFYTERNTSISVVVALHLPARLVNSASTGCASPSAILGLPGLVTVHANSAREALVKLCTPCSRVTATPHGLSVNPAPLVRWATAFPWKEGADTRHQRLGVSHPWSRRPRAIEVIAERTPLIRSQDLNN